LVSNVGVHAQELPSVNIGYIYCQQCAVGGRSVWVLEEALRRMKALLDLPAPEAFFQPMVDAGVLGSLPPDMYRLYGPKKLLLDQANVDDALESSVWQLYSARRTAAANIPFALGRQVCAGCRDAAPPRRCYALECTCGSVLGAVQCPGQRAHDTLTHSMQARGTANLSLPRMAFRA
jgi:hypothetical protein